VTELFRAEVWNRFCAEHCPDFHQTVFLPSLVADPAAVASHIATALAAATTRRGPDDRVLPRIRGFRGSAFDYRLTESLTFGGFDGDDIPGWLRDAGDAEPVCLAFNEVDTWNQDLADILYRELTAPLTTHVGELSAGIDWYSFVGESSWTPFGIHDDPEVSMIFHLGPASKRVWVWDGPPPPTLPHGRRISADFAHLLPDAREFVLEPGDFLSIPAYRLHVFENTGPSVFLGLTIYPRDAREEVLELARATLLAAGADGDDPNTVSAIAKQLGSDLLGRHAEAELERRALRRRSCGYSKKPRSRAEATDPGVVMEATFRVTTRPVAWTVNRGGGSTLHVCGRDVDVPSGFDADGLVALLTSRGTVIGAEVVDAIAPGRRDRGAVEVVRALERCWGLRRVDAAAAATGGNPTP